MNDLYNELEVNVFVFRINIPGNWVKTSLITYPSSLSVIFCLLFLQARLSYRLQQECSADAMIIQLHTRLVLLLLLVTVKCLLLWRPISFSLQGCSGLVWASVSPEVKIPALQAVWSPVDTNKTVKTVVFPAWYSSAQSWRSWEIFFWWLPLPLYRLGWCGAVVAYFCRKHEDALTW